MFSNDNDFKKDLVAHKVYSAWQFIQYTQKNIDIVQFCFETISRIIDKMTIKTNRWEQNLFSDFVEETLEDGRKAHKVSVTTENMPVYELYVAGAKVDPWFMFDKLVRDFYQYAMNSFDSMSQVANAGLLANKSKKVDSVDFQKMRSCFGQNTYKTAFPKTSLWYDTIATSAEFQYIEAINNRTKHTADISNKLSMGILGISNTTKIGPFFRKEKQHEEKELTDQLQATIDFLNKAWEDFLSVFCDEYRLDAFAENRRHKIGGVYQQKLKNEPNQDLSYAYIEVENDFSTMPNEIFILFVRNDDDIIAHDCPFERILVRGENEHEIVGRYVADDKIGDDCLLHYRKYIKDGDTEGPICRFYEHRETTKFYHWNQFFNLTTVSDDDDFLKRVNCPF